MGAPGWKYDIALSFAGSERAYVHQVAGALKELGLRVFYDSDEQVALYGNYLTEVLPAVYGEQAALVAMFISAEYARRDWTIAERRAALERAARERREYILPARFDDTALPGVLSSLVHVDLHGYTPGKFAELLHAKWASLDLTPRPRTSAARKADFQVSYVGADRRWATWIAEQLRRKRFVVDEQAWEASPGAGAGDDGARRTDAASALLVVASRAYLATAYADAAWLETYGGGGQGHPLAVARVEECDTPGSLGGAPSCDLFGLDATAASGRLVDLANAARFGVPVPSSDPPFPGAGGDST